MIIKILGMFEATIETKKRITVANFYVTPGNPGCLLNAETAQALELISFHVCPVKSYPNGNKTNPDRCMIKIFWGAGVVTPSNPPPPMNIFCFYLPPVFRGFCKDPLMTPTTLLQAYFTATPLPILHPFPLYKF